MSDFSDAKVGDLVWSLLYGWGRVVSTTYNKTYPILVMVDNGKDYYTFTLEGFLCVSNTNPTLFWDEVKITPPPKPKRKIKKKLEGWVNVYPNDFLLHVYKSKDEADSSATPRRIACAYVSGEYEVEEE